MSKQTGGWTISWQGDGNTRADFPNAQTICDGISHQVSAAGGKTTLSADGSFSETPDVAIVVFGEDPYAEGVGDRSDVAFTTDAGRNLQIMRRLKAQGIPVVAIFLSGRPLYVTPEINIADAFVAAWLPGSEGGGIADVLFRKPDGSVQYDFRGRLSFSWPRAPDQTPLNVGDPRYNPLFPYGYGLGYADPRDTGILPEAAAPLAAPSS
jgi:beta-glucosidase